MTEGRDDTTFPTPPLGWLPRPADPNFCGPPSEALFKMSKRYRILSLIPVNRHFARNLYDKIDEIEFRGKVPLLCHQEYLQLIYGLDTKERVRALAKGRWFPKKMSGIDGKGSGSDQILPEEQDQEGQKEGELFMGEDLSELQQLGREKMLERLDKLTRRID